MGGEPAIRTLANHYFSLLFILAANGSGDGGGNGGGNGGSGGQKQQQK
jgi:hypothetical protein